MDAEGRAVPGAFGRDAVGKGLPDSNKRPRRLQRFEAGEKQRYFADDDAKDLQDPGQGAALRRGRRH